MLNYLWGFMIIIGIVYAALNGTMPAVTQAALDSSKEAVTLCTTMVGVMSFWVGIMKIAETSGMVEGITKKLAPFVHFMFPGIPRNHKANEHISTNIIANALGLGWAATPAGLKAMEELRNLNIEQNGQKKEHIASKEMCTFLVLNISSLQLIPVNIIAYRSQYGSANPTAIVGPAIVATMVSTLVGILYCKWKGRRA